MHSTALPLALLGRTSPKPKHCPTSSSGFQVDSSHASFRDSTTFADEVPPIPRSPSSAPSFRLPPSRNWPLQRCSGWSENHAGTPSFSIPSRTSPPWRHPTSRRCCHNTHAGSSQQDLAHSATVVAASGAAPPSGAPLQVRRELPQQAHDLQICALSRPLGMVGGSFFMLLPPAIFVAVFIITTLPSSAASLSRNPKLSSCLSSNVRSPYDT